MFGLGSSAQLGLGIAITLQDRFSGTAAKVMASMTRMKREGSAMVDQAARDYQQGATRVAAIAGAMTYGMFQMAKQGAALSHQVNLNMILAAGKMGATRDQIKKAVNDISMEFAQMPVDILTQRLENVRAGATGAIDELTRYQAAAAVATGEKLSGQEGAGSNILGALFTFNLPITKDNIAKVTNAIVAGANLSKASIASIGKTLQYAGQTFREYGFNIEQSVAMAAKLSQANIESTTAGVAMNQMIRELGKAVSQNATKKQISAWQVLGIDPNTIHEKVIQNDLFGIINQIQTAAGKIKDNVQRNAGALDPLFGVRGGKGIMAAFRSLVEGGNLEDFMKGIQRYQEEDITIKQGKAAAKDPFSDIIRTEAQWELFKMEFVETISPELHMFATFLQKTNVWLKDFSNSSLGSLVLQAAAIMVPMIAVMAGFRAAMIAATFGLRGFVRSSGVGGFSGIMGGLLGSIGRQGTANSIYGAMTKNKAGGYNVRPGFQIFHAGKTYSGLRKVPSAALASGSGAIWGPRAKGVTSWMGPGASSFAKGSGALSRAGGFMSKASTSLGTMASTGLRFLPVIGNIAMIGSLLYGIYDMTRDKAQEERDQNVLNAQSAFTLQAQQAIWGLANSSASIDPKKWAINRNQQLIINLNVDGLRSTQEIRIDPNKPFHDLDVQFNH